MLNKYVYYITLPFIGPVVVLIALLDMPKNWEKFKKNFTLIYGGIK